MLCALVFLCGVFVIPGQLDFSDGPRWQLLSLVLPLLFLAWGSSWHPFALAILLYSLLSASWAIVFWDALWGLWTLTLLFLACGIGARLENLDGVMKAAAWALGVNAVLLLFQYQGHFNEYLPPGAGNFPAGTFYNKNFLAEASAVVFCWTAQRQRYWICLMILPNLLLTISAGALAAVAAGLVALFCARLWLLIIVGFFIAVFAWILHPAGATVRFELWEAVALGILAKPWGHGIGQFYALLPAFLTDTLATRHEHAHNEFLEASFELGVFGGLCFVGIFLAAIARAKDGRAALVALGFLALVGFPLKTPFMLLLSGLLLGHTLRGWRPYRYFVLSRTNNVE